MNIKDIFSSNRFSDWSCLNDTIMGGKSNASITISTDGLLLEGNVIEDGGGFISCRSAMINPPLNLKLYKGIELHIDGEGRQLKIALSSKDSFLGIDQIISTGIKWVFTFTTNVKGTTVVRIPFDELQANLRARKVFLPIKFNKKRIERFQLLYSKFGKSGEVNHSFSPGQTKILLRCINAYA